MNPFRPLLLLMLGALSLALPAGAETLESTTRQLIADSLQVDSERLMVEIRQAADVSECIDHEVFLPYAPNARSSRVNVGVRCHGEQTKNLYFQAAYQVTTPYWRLKLDGVRGDVVSIGMIERHEGDLAKLPRGAITSADEIAGKQLNRSVRKGTIIQENILEVIALVARDEKVSVIASGNGFDISRDGIAMENGAMGQTIKIKLMGGEIIFAEVIGNNRLKVDF